MADLDDLPAHLEKYLGTISNGWSDPKSESGISIACFKNMPDQGVDTYVTLGLSSYLLELPNARTIRQELIFSAEEEFSGEQVAGFLMSLAESFLRKKTAILRGQVIGPAHPLIPEVKVNGVYFTNPSPFPEGLLSYEAPESPLVFVLVVPLAASEATAISEKGWRLFEDKLEEQDPNIWDLNREQVVAL